MVIEMPTSKLLGKLTSCLLFILIAMLTASCGGGGDTNDPAPSDNTSTENFIQISARTGSIQVEQVGSTVVLDGSKSFLSSTYPTFTASSDPLSFNWEFTHIPNASETVLQNSTTANPSFVLDVSGVYIAQLVVSADGLTSQRDLATVVATEDLVTNHNGKSSKCANCHNSAIEVGKTADHMATSNACEACHSPHIFDPTPFVDHLENFGNCSDCHNGDVAIGKSENHVETDAQCDECHNTSHFLTLELDGSFDHSGVTSACQACHNGIVAIGKHDTHSSTNEECGFCHTTDSFEGAYPDHTGPEVVGERCDLCHNNDPNDPNPNGRGPSVGHPLTNVDCAQCHSIISFNMDGVFNHSLVDSSVQSCESCHNDNTSINALAKSAALNHPVTTSDCGSCHNTETFIGAFIDHTGIVDNCATSGCHTGLVGEAIGKHNNHIVTIEDCSVCHTPGTFTTGTYDHAGVTNNCVSCHDNSISVGKLPNHIPTNPDSQDCVDCHTTTTFTPATFAHVGIDTNNCTLCHNGDISLGKSSNHVPTSLDCSSCHDINNYDSFAGITFNHLGIDNNDCASCHANGIATGKTLNHIPSLQECSVCHLSTDTFTTNIFLTAVHQDLTRGCEGCHVRQFLTDDLIKNITHLPVNQDCYVCHDVNGFTPSSFNHEDITSNCASCHDGSANYESLGALGEPDTAIHQNTSGDCSLCHSITGFTDAFIDHNDAQVTSQRCDTCHNGVDATGMEAKTNPPHILTSDDCVLCHEAGASFTPALFDHQGIVDNCQSCHDGTYASGLSQGHVPIADTQDCSNCHNTDTFAGARFDHQGIVDNCFACHNGTTAPGKTPPPNHVPTNDDCVACHQTTGFLPATFNHSGIVDNCSSCHGAGFAIGKPGDHVLTIQDCGICHNITGFIPATFDHTSIVDNCSSCHGVTATGKSQDHIATSLDCSLCHTTATFAGGTWAHDSSSVGNCDQCHSADGGATFKSNDHLSTNEQCDVCHTTNGWAPTDFTHDPNGNYPGDHRRDPGCRGCHTGTIGSGIHSGNYPNQLQYAPFCAGCHAGDFRSKGDHIGGKSGTIQQNMDCSNGGRGCHRVSDREWD